MKMKTIVLQYLFASYLGLLTACSGGGVNVEISGPDIDPITLPWTDEAITAHGVNTGQGQIIVNDIAYATSHATVTVNGRPGTLTDLRRGQVITINGTVHGGSFSGTADRIDYDARLIGPVESLDGSNNQLIVMGQTVISGPDTDFAAGIDPASYVGLSIGTNVEISGFARADGAILATRIAPIAGGTKLQLVGEVEDLDLANLLFTVNRLSVDYSGALAIDLPGGAPSNGMTVKMIGDLAGGRFVVETLGTAPALGSVTGRRVQTAGLVTHFNSTRDFYVNHYAVATNSGTTFLNGDQGDLALNAELVVDGNVASNGRVTADRITFGRLVARTETLSFALSDFDEIAVSTVFKVTVTQGDEFLVEVKIDDDQKHRVNVTQTGSRLNIALGAGSGNIHTLHAFVTMPVLERIDVNGTVAVTLQDFEQEQMTVNLGGVSVLQGNALRIDRLTANVSGVSVLNLGNIRPIGYADIDVNGVSAATLNMDVGSTLTGTVGAGQGTGISSLFYYGTNVNLDLTTGSMSSVQRLGPTRP
jgi:hypothetical protein